MTTDYNVRSAVVTVRAESPPGPSGVNTWVETLAQMYFEWARHRSLPGTVYDVSYSADNKINSITFVVDAFSAYGVLLGENGIHQFTEVPLPRQDREVVSRAEVTVLPGARAFDQFEIPDTAIQVEGVTAKAVRITHKPTRTVVTCQGWPSPQENTEGAMFMLRTRLLDKRRQIARPGGITRAYLDGPAKLVKDLRSGHSDMHLRRVLAGYIDEFLIANIRQRPDLRVSQTFMGIEACTSERSD